MPNLFKKVNETTAIQWQIPEYEYQPKDIAWRWLSLIAAIILFAFAIWQKNFLFAVFLIVAALLTITWARRLPKTTDFTLSEKGLDIGGKKFYPYEGLVGFAIVSGDQDTGFDELIVKTKGQLNTLIKIIIISAQGGAIKNLLSRFIPEIEYRESVSDRLARLLRL